MRGKRLLMILVVLWLFASPAGATPTVSNIATNESSYPNGDIPKLNKFEITFDVDTVAEELMLPYDSSPPAGVTPSMGISVDALVTPDNWTTTYTVPGFWCKGFERQLKSNRDWMYPTGVDKWTIRFAPTQPGTWKYKLKAQDTSGIFQTSEYTFTCVDSSDPGFLKVSSDARYFEFENGTQFPGLGYNLTWGTISFNNPVKNNTTLFASLQEDGMQLFRTWFSHWSAFCASWSAWSSPLVSLHSQYIPEPSLSMTYYYQDNDVSMGLFWTWNPGMWIGHFTQSPPVKRDTNYHIFIRYYIPTTMHQRIGGYSYGLCAKTSTSWLGGDNVYLYCDPGTGVVVSNYAHDATTGWQTLEGSFNSGASDYLPSAGGFFILCLENIDNTAGTTAFIDEVRVCEDLGGGSYGPNIIGKDRMCSHISYDQQKCFAMDKTIELAEQYDIYFKLVLMEKNDWILDRIAHDGTLVPGSPSNDNFYGNWESMTKNRWLQQAWWRYCQARWGYSTHIQSWETLNEGDPSTSRHFALANKFGEYFDQFVPNRHVTTTSNWSGFPMELWDNPYYPCIDYADYHNYPGSYNDVAARIEAYNNSYGAYMAGGANKPMILGEVGFGAVINDDTAGIWYHNFTWANTHHGGVYQQYWCEHNEFGTGYDERNHNKPYRNFIEDVPLNNTHYVALAPTINGTNIRVFGQKDLTNKNAHLWIQNNQHTWYNIVNGIPVGSVTGTIDISGFTPSATYDLEWWDPYEPVKANQIISSTQVNANGSGVITLSVTNLVDDIAAKIFATTGDTTPPTPNPSTWATMPYATGSTSISMTATTASDPSGVQYFFDCTAGAGGHDSVWQSSSTYQDTGLTPSTQYSYRVRTRDQSVSQNTGNWSTTQSATTNPPADTTPPTPNPSTWATVPYATGSTSVSMTATTASDPSGVQYFFDCTAGAGGHDSGWQSGATYQDTGLTPSTQYSYRVQTRDQSANQNTGGWSTTQSATTQAGADVTPPTPDPLTWATVPYATGSTSISMTATTASDPSGVEYYFDCTAGAGGHDSVWQASPTYQDTGLTPSTQYTYRVQARDCSTNHNTGGWSTSQAATTQAAGSGHDVFASGAYANGWSGIGTTTFQSQTVLNASTTGTWQWKNISNTTGKDVLAYPTWQYGIWCDSAGVGDSIEWHIVSPTGQEWTGTYQFKDPAVIDGVPQTLPYTLSTNAWHTVSFDLSTKAWWAADGDTIQYLKWQFPEQGTYYMRNVKFVGAGDTTAPTPNPSTWATVPYATGSTSISMTATTASDPSGVQYFFDCTAGAGGHDSAWQSSATYQDTGLTPSTQYTYRVQTRDQSSNQNTGAWSTTQSVTTNPGGPVTLLTDGFETDFNKWTDGGTTDWDRATSQKYAGSYSAHAGSADNDLISDNLNTTGYSSITVDFWFRDDDIDDGDNIYLQLYNGSAYANRYELGNSTEDAWNHAVITVNNSGGDTVYFISNFRIKFEGSSIDTGENLWIDAVLVTAQ